MRSEDDLEFARVLNGLAVVKTGAKITKEALAIWFNAFQSWSIQDFTAAASHFVMAVQWMPNPYHFEQLRRAGEPTAGEAWTTAVENCLSWRTGTSAAGELIDRVVAMVGGYRAIALADQDTALPHIERRFKEAYAQLAEREPIREALPQIAKPPSRVALRGPAPIVQCLPAELRRAPAATLQPVVIEAPAQPTAPRIHVSDSVKVEKLARSMPTLTDEELAKVACVPIETVRHVRASLESAA